MTGIVAGTLVGEEEGIDLMGIQAHFGMAVAGMAALGFERSG